MYPLVLLNSEENINNGYSFFYLVEKSIFSSVNLITPNAV